jgi:hypothetical protein
MRISLRKNAVKIENSPAQRVVPVPSALEIFVTRGDSG